MNEIKRQLNQKMGNTSERSMRVMKHVEQQKKMKRTSTKRSTSFAFYITFTTVAAALALFFYFAPWQSESPLHTATPNVPVTSEPSVETLPLEEDVSYKELLRSYFRETNSYADFLGTGNEYATFYEETTWINEDYVKVLVDNSGGRTLNIYRITDNEIQLIYNQYYDSTMPEPSLDKIRILPPIETVLVAPFEDGKIFDVYTMQTNVELETPFNTFTTVAITNEETNVTRYYAEGMWLVGEKYVLEDGYIIESYLMAINGEYNADENASVTVYNESTRKDETYTVKEFESVDSVEYHLSPNRYAITYRSLKTLSNGEIGVFSHSCFYYEQCTHEFVYKTGNSFLTIETLSNVSYGNLVYAPNESKVAIGISGIYPHYDDAGKEMLIEVSGILSIDFNTIASNVENASNYVGYYYPIVAFKWLDNETLELEVPQIANDLAKTVYEWQNSDRPTVKKTLSVK